MNERIVLASRHNARVSVTDNAVSHCEPLQVNAACMDSRQTCGEQRTKLVSKNASCWFPMVCSIQVSAGLPLLVPCQ